MQKHKKPNVWLFHEINDDIMESIKNISRNDPTSILTFDDGLYSAYSYLNKLKELPNKKIFFISLGIIRPNCKEPIKDFIICSDAHNQKNLDYYMSPKEINEIENLDPKYNCFIGLHGVDHIKCTFKNSLITHIKYPKIASGSEFFGLKECIEVYKEEIDKMLILSDILLNKTPKYFSWPYNIENEYMRNIFIQKLRTYKYNFEFFGKERLQIEN